MKIIKRIVVGIDFSVYSPELLQAAADVAERNSAEIIAVNVINKRLIEAAKKESDASKFYSFSLEKYINDEESKRTHKLDELMGQWVSKQLATRTIIKSGVPFEEILKVVEHENADLLVMSSRGRTNFQDFMFGTTAEKIFRHSPVSVLSLNIMKKQ